MSEIRKYADEHQYEAEPMPEGNLTENGVQPRVHLLWITPDPLGAVAAMAAMYEGRVVRSLGEISDQDRLRAFEDVQKTHLKAPLEAIKLHFLIEGVDRAFTHQLVRQRTAVYAQESMRFAVIGNLLEATTLPPWLAEKEPESAYRAIWDDIIDRIDTAYHTLVDAGMPSEEARGLLPHCTATRIHYITDLRNLSDHSGNRLCTQAQFHWRSVFSQIARAIAEYGTDWQFEAIGSSELFRPVCYQLGRCPFKASFDRSCSIRDRVDMFEEAGEPSTRWGDKERHGNDAINPAEWLIDPSAARK